MDEELKKIAAYVKAEVAKIKDLKALEDFEIKIIGRKAGQLTEFMKGIKNLSDDDKRKVGPVAQQVRKEVEETFATKKLELSGSAAGAETIDLTLPGERPALGHLHLTTQAITEIEDIFKRIGFVRTRYPEVEWDYYAFEALNMPSDHPARDDWETFFITPPDASSQKKMILTPHTSSGQVREMEKGKLPIRMINISKCYRRQSDISHVPMFHQFEGLLVDDQVSITHLKGVLDFFARSFFGPERVTRIRPFHFRFVEPGFEIDISCGVCRGTGKVDGNTCRLCKEGWLELGGAGMVHPNVLKAGKLDPKKVSGFAFGWGVERVMMMKSQMNIDDIRLLYKNDLRFLEQF